MNDPKTPIMRNDAASMTIIQMLSCMAGQWYRWMRATRRSGMYESVPVIVDAAILTVGVGAEQGSVCTAESAWV